MIMFLQGPESEGLGRLGRETPMPGGLEAVSIECEKRCPLCIGGLPGSHTTSSLLLSWSFSRGTFFSEKALEPSHQWALGRGLWC